MAAPRVIQRYYTACKFTTLLLLTCCLIISKASCNDDDLKPKEEFTHLLDRLGSSKRLHIVSELVRNEHQLQIEEHLDLDTWNQLIQFRWHQDARGLGDEGLTTKKVNVLVVNSGPNPQMIQYSPYQCKATPLNAINASADWRVEVAASIYMSPDDLAISADVRHNRTITSLIYLSPNNPYMSIIKDDQGNDVRIFGIAGAWAKARYPGGNNKPPTQLPQMEHWTMILDDAEVQVDYYFDSELLMGASPSQDPADNTKRDLLSAIEMKSSHSQSHMDLVNIHDMDLNFGDQLARDLFKVPIGFNCPAIKTDSKQLTFYQGSDNQLLELEIIATKWLGLKDESLLSQTEIKTLSLATSTHPMDLSSKLSMLHDHEDRFRVIHDYYHKIKYTIHYKGAEQACQIDKLHFPRVGNSSNSISQAADMLSIDFNNGINLTLDDRIVDYILNMEDADKQVPINRIKSSEVTDELVFESELPATYQRILSMTNRDLRYMAPKISLIRVFEQTTFEFKGERKVRRFGTLHLKRIILMVFDTSRQSKFAEIRLNILETVDRLSLQRRAKLFDLSRCYDLDNESLKLVASYPLESKALDQALRSKHSFIEYFYTQATRNLVKSNQTDSEDIAADEDIQHLARSLNFLRIPKVDVLSSMTGDLELRVTILDRLSLRHLYDALPESTLADEIVSEKFLSQSDIDCARLCQHFNCLMFSYAFDISECKLAHVRHDANDQNEGFIELKRGSTVFYFGDPDQDIGASLYELHSFLEHSAQEDFEDRDGIDSEVEVDTPDREKRSTTARKPPVMSFMFLDLSEGEYAYPVMRTLIPSKIEMLRSPIIFEVTDDSIPLRVKSTFESKTDGKRYILTALDQEGEVNVLETSRTRSFEDRDNEVYYTGQITKDLSLDVCMSLCYDIDEWDASSYGARVCTSFSYCSYDKECILMIKTDKNYTNDIYDVAEEGDIVPQIESLDRIIRDDHGCILAERNRVSDYDGPLRMVDYSRSINHPEFKVDIDYEWLKVFSTETSAPQALALNKCADECYKMNKRFKLCTGFDYCESIPPTDTRMGKYRANCYLMMIHEEKDKTQTSTFKVQLNELRNQMVRGSKISSRSNTSSNSTSGNSKCYRYLTSNIREFTHLKQHGVSEFMLQHAKIGRPANDDLNLDSCALQCLQDGSKCLAFEFCSTLDPATKKLVRNCTMIGGLRYSAPSLTDEGGQVANQQLTFYSKDCHLYLRREFKTMDDLYSFVQTTRPHPSEHRTLIITFSCIYGVALLTVILFIVSKKRGMGLFGSLENWL